MEEAKRLSVHVAVCHDEVFLKEFLETLRSQTFTDYQLTVVGGQDMGELAQDPNIVWLRNFNWQGYARAHNQAIALALSRYPQDVWHQRFLAIIHPDVLLSTQTFARMAEAFARDPELMVATPNVRCARITMADDLETRQVETTDQIEEIGVNLSRWRRRVRRGAGETDQGQWDAPADVFAASECCAFFRVSALAKLERDRKCLNETLPEGQAMLDLSRRCHALGMKIQTVPSAVIWHHRHQRSTETLGNILRRWFV